MCEITTALHITSSARPHFEPGHVTPRSPLLCVLNQNHDEFLNGLNCGFVTRCIFSSSPLFSREYCSNSSRERLKKNATVYKRRYKLIVNSRLIGPVKYNPAPDWLIVSCWPKVDSQRVGNSGGTKKKKNSELHHAPPLSRFGLITGKSFVLRLY